MRTRYGRERVRFLVLDRDLDNLNLSSFFRETIRTAGPRGEDGGSVERLGCSTGVSSGAGKERGELNNAKLVWRLMRSNCPSVWDGKESQLPDML
jgi:hypothetical protein